MAAVLGEMGTKKCAILRGKWRTSDEGMDLARIKLRATAALVGFELHDESQCKKSGTQGDFGSENVIEIEHLGDPHAAMKVLVAMSSRKAGHLYPHKLWGCSQSDAFKMVRAVISNLKCMWNMVPYCFL